MGGGGGGGEEVEMAPKEFQSEKTWEHGKMFLFKMVR